MMDRLDILQMVAGPLPPFIEELRDKIRGGEKTETRRVAKPQPPDWRWSSQKWHDACVDISSPADDRRYFVKCPYGQADQIRYLREPLVRSESFSDQIALYRDDLSIVYNEHGLPIPWRWKRNVLPQIFMPKVAARTFVRQSHVGVERVQEISEEGAIAEGVEYMGFDYWKNYKAGWTQHQLTARSSFATLWNSINAERGLGWGVNPWVWVLKFGVVFGGKEKTYPRSHTKKHEEKARR